MSYVNTNQQMGEEFSPKDREIVFRHDLSGRFTFLNKAGELILGYTREEACQMNIRQLVAPELVELVHAPTADDSSEVLGAVYELDLIAKDGRRVELEISTETVSLDGQPTEIQGIALPSVVRSTA